jgi:hypothetical protein
MGGEGCRRGTYEPLFTKGRAENGSQAYENLGIADNPKLWDWLHDELHELKRAGVKDYRQNTQE